MYRFQGFKQAIRVKLSNCIIVNGIISMFVILSFGSFMSCGTKQKDTPSNESKDAVEIRPPYMIGLEGIIDDAMEVNISTISNQIIYVPLETNEDCLLKRVHNYVFFDNNILVSDMLNLFQFDLEGNFIKKIGRRGNGPSDYVYINSILFNNIANEFNLFTSGKILTYDSDMNYVKSMPHTGHYFSSVATSWGNSLMFLGSYHKMPEDTVTIYSFSEIDALGNTIKKIPDSSPIIANYPGMIVGHIPLYKYKEEIRYMDYGNDTLYVYTQDEPNIPYAICDLGNMKREINTANYNPKQIEELSNKLLVYNICEDDEYLYITLHWGMSYDNLQYILFNKKDGTLNNIGSRGFVNDLDGGVPFFPQYITEDGDKIMWMNAEEFIEESKESNDPGLASIRSKIKEDDNPICIIVKSYEKR